MFDCVLKMHVQFSAEKKNPEEVHKGWVSLKHTLSCTFSGIFVYTFIPTTILEQEYGSEMDIHPRLSRLNL